MEGDGEGVRMEEEGEGDSTDGEAVGVVVS